MSLLLLASSFLVASLMRILIARVEVYQLLLLFLVASLVRIEVYQLLFLSLILTALSFVLYPIRFH